jgi:hypothetical protein
MDCQLSTACLEVIVALARYSVHESERRPCHGGMLTHIHLRSSTYCALYVTVSMTLNVHQRTISYHHTMSRLPSYLEAAVCNSQHNEAHILSRYSKPSRRSPTTVGMGRHSFSGTDNDGCEGPVNTHSSLIIDQVIITIKKGCRLLAIRRSLMGDVVVNDGQFGRVGEANSWRVK